MHIQASLLFVAAVLSHTEALARVVAPSITETALLDATYQAIPFGSARKLQPPFLTDTAELLASYHAMQFDGARKLQRQLISERARHATAVRQLRRTYRTSTNALRRRIRELGVDVTGALPRHRSPADGRAAFASRVASAATEVADDSAASLRTGDRSIGTPRQEPSRGAAIASDGAARTLLQEASPSEPSCSMDELMAVQADPMAAVIALFATNPSCATCLVPCGSALDALSCAMGCLKQARDETTRPMVD